MAKGYYEIAEELFEVLSAFIGKEDIANYKLPKDITFDIMVSGADYSAAVAVINKYRHVFEGSSISKASETKDSVEPLELELISILDAVEKGLTRLRRPIWKLDTDHIEITIIDKDGNKGVGPWVRMYSTANMAINARDPVDLLITAFDTVSREWLLYLGPTSDSDEYKEAAKENLDKYREFLGKKE